MSVNKFYSHQSVKTILDLLSKPREQSIFVRGPRGVGKTFMARRALGCMLDENIYEYHYISPLSTEMKKDKLWLLDQWNIACSFARASGKPYVLVIDDIQTINDWSAFVKCFIDSNRTINIVLLLNLSDTNRSESLLGRFFPVNVTHWSFAEMMGAFYFSFDDYVYFGGYPGGAGYVGDEADWRNYVRNAVVQPTIEIDILKMVRIDKPALFKQLFELSCTYSGQILSYNKMLGQLRDAGNTTTLTHYLDLLERAGLVIGIQQYSKKLIKTKQSPPKLNVLNTALMTVASTYSKEQALADRSYWGRMIESAVGAHIYNTMDSNTKLYYWREENYEVDFVVERGGRLFTIEVRSDYKQSDSMGFNRFVNKFGDCDDIILGNDGIPVQEFLSHPVDHWLV